MSCGAEGSGLGERGTALRPREHATGCPIVPGPNYLFSLNKQTDKQTLKEPPKDHGFETAASVCVARPRDSSVTLLLCLIVPVLWLQLPRVFVDPLDVLDADFLQDVLQVAHGLFRDVHQVLEVVILVLLEG